MSEEGGPETWVFCPALLLIGCVTFGRSFKLSEQQFSHVTNGDITTLKQLKGLREM